MPALFRQVFHASRVRMGGGATGLDAAPVCATVWSHRGAHESDDSWLFPGAHPAHPAGPARGLPHERGAGHRSRLSQEPEQDADGRLKVPISFLTKCTLYGTVHSHE